MTSLIDELCDLFKCRPLKLRDLLRHPHKKEKARQFLEGKSLRTTYLKENHTFTFGNLTIQGANQLFAYEGFLGVTVQQHYYCRHRIRLEHSMIPCVVIYGPKGHNSFYPLELLCIDQETDSFWKL